MSYYNIYSIWNKFRHNRLLKTLSNYLQVLTFLMKKHYYLIKTDNIKPSIEVLILVRIYILIYFIFKPQIIYSKFSYLLFSNIRS